MLVLIAKFTLFTRGTFRADSTDCWIVVCCCAVMAVPAWD